MAMLKATNLAPACATSKAKKPITLHSVPCYVKIHCTQTLTPSSQNRCNTQAQSAASTVYQYYTPINSNWTKRVSSLLHINYPSNKPSSHTMHLPYSAFLFCKSAIFVISTLTAGSIFVHLFASLCIVTHRCPLSFRHCHCPPLCLASSGNKRSAASSMRRPYSRRAMLRAATSLPVTCIKGIQGLKLCVCVCVSSWKSISSGVEYRIYSQQQCRGFLNLCWNWGRVWSFGVKTIENKWQWPQGSFWWYQISTRVCSVIPPKQYFFQRACALLVVFVLYPFPGDPKVPRLFLIFLLGAKVRALQKSHCWAGKPRTAKM